MGGVEGAPRRIREAEITLDGRPVEARTFDEAASVAAAAVRPFDDYNNTIQFRRGLVKTLTKRALELAS